MFNPFTSKAARKLIQLQAQLDSSKDDLDKMNASDEIRIHWYQNLYDELMNNFYALIEDKNNLNLFYKFYHDYYMRCNECSREKALLYIALYTTSISNRIAREGK